MTTSSSGPTMQDGSLVEQEGLLGDRHAGLGRVVGIIEADGDEIADLAEARAEPGRSPHRRQGLRLEFSEPRKSARSKHVGVDIRHHVAQIPQFSILIDQRRLLLARPAISCQFHKPSQSKPPMGPEPPSHPAARRPMQALPNAGGVGPSMLTGSLCRNPLDFRASRSSRSAIRMRNGGRWSRRFSAIPIRGAGGPLRRSHRKLMKSQWILRWRGSML